MLPSVKQAHTISARSIRALTTVLDFDRAKSWISKQWLTLADTYGVQITAGQDDVLILACTVVIDMCCHPDRQE